MTNLQEYARASADAAAEMFSAIMNANNAAIDEGNELAEIVFGEQIEELSDLRDRLSRIARALGA